jgi:maltose O-acetyltransferase
MKKALKKIFGKTTVYRFFSWIFNKYLEEQFMLYSPDQFKEYGRDVMIDKTVQINMPQRIVLKDRVRIFGGTLINSRGGLYIGENSGISNNCTILTDLHHYRNAKTIPFDNIIDLKPVIIREFVWIGLGVMIMPGIEIGEGAIIGMGSVVTKNVPPLAILLGNPAEIIGYRSKDHYYSCKSSGKYQEIRINNYEENLPYMYKIRFEKELRELGIME